MKPKILTGYLGNHFKEWGLIQAIGLKTYPVGKFTPFFFLLTNLYLSTFIHKLSVSPQTPLNVDNYNSNLRLLTFYKPKGPVGTLDFMIGFVFHCISMIFVTLAHVLNFKHYENIQNNRSGALSPGKSSNQR